MFNKINILFVTFFYIGKIKLAPGTFASFLTCVLFYFLLYVLSIFFLFLITLIIFLYSFVAINNSFNEFNSEDPQEIVIDEVVGQAIPLLFIPIYETLYPTNIIVYFIFSFILFRFFDILKPFPIKYVDENVKGVLGIMLDDVLAGFFTLILMSIAFFFIGG